MRRCLRLSVLFLTLSALFIPAQAVTNAEMEQARAIAAKTYLRYVNNGSGYLDELKPTSVADLKGSLRETELDNLKAFESLKAATDYASWDKEKLAQYWSATFFNDNASSLKSEGAANSLARKSISNQIKAMKVTAPTAGVTEADAVATPPSDQNPETALLAQEKDALEAQIADQQAQIEQQDQNPAPAPIKKESSGTWVYVMILCILVAVVIALVIYAARTMKSQKVAPGEISENSGADTRKSESAVVEESRMREKFAENLAAKNEEIRNLHRKVADLEAEAMELRVEVKRLRKEAEASQAALAVKAESGVPAKAKERVEEPREIYLGRVNAKGIFVRADRKLSPGHTVYKLTTTNGLTGTYQVVKDPTLDALAMEAPEVWLGGGCVAKDITDTVGRETVVNEQPGTAVFEDGMWKVLRKAKIHYA